MTATRLENCGLIAWLVLASAGCVANPSPPVLTLEGPSAPSRLEHQVEERVRDWFAHLEDPGELSGELSRFLGDRRCEFRLPDRTVRGRAQLLAWASLAHRPFTRVEFDVGPIEFRAGESGLVRAEFEVDRRAWDEANLLHISRSRQVWRIGVGDEDTLLLFDAEESTVLPHPGTGTQVLCL